MVFLPGPQIKSGQQIEGEREDKVRKRIYTPIPLDTSSSNPGAIDRFISNRLPVPVLQDEPDLEPLQRQAPDPDVGARWGRPADLVFQIPSSLGGTQQKENPTMAVVEDFDERHYFNGVGVQKATDHFGSTVAESPPFDEQSNPFKIRTVYFCGTFLEKSEKRKTLPTGVEVITPIETHVRQYVQWDEVPNWIDEYHSVAWVHDEAPVPPGGSGDQCGKYDIGPG